MFFVRKSVLNNDNLLLLKKNTFRPFLYMNTKNFKLIFPLLFLMFVIDKINAQDHKKITGKVITETGIPMDNVVISVSQNDSLFHTAVSDMNGDFSITTLLKGEVAINATHVSYNDFQKTFNIDSIQKVWEIKLENRQTVLDEAVVNFKKPLITRKIDRTVLNISQSPLSTGKAALELLQVAPGVFVKDGDISIAGNPGVRVMINGRILTLTGASLNNYLLSLRSEEIESIEIIARPPAEYDAAGSGGLINIILKKKRDIGFQGSANLGYTQGRYPGTNGSLQLRLKQNKFSLSSDYSNSNSKSYENISTSRQINKTIDFSSQNDRIMDSQSHRFSLGGTYDLDSNQYIGLQYTGSFVKSSSVFESVVNVSHPTPQQANDETVKGEYPQNRKTDYNNLGFDYRIKLDTLGSSLSFATDYTHNDLNVANSAHSKFYSSTGEYLKDSLFRNRTPSIAKVYTAEIKAQKYFNETSILGVGLKYSDSEIDNQGMYENFHDGAWQQNPQQDFNYLYQEKIAAAFLNYSGGIKKLEYQLGIRAENTSTKGLLLPSTENRKTYFDIFPSVFLKMQVDQEAGNYLTAYYGERISRAAYSFLSPYETYADNYTVGRGNPDLRPSYTDSYQTGFTFKNKYSLTLGYDIEKNTISQLIEQLPTDPLVTLYSYGNIGKRTNLSATLYVPIDFTNSWSMMNNIIMRKQEFSTSNVSIKKNIIDIQSYQSIDIKSLFSLELLFLYSSNQLSDLFLLQPHYRIDMGIQRRFLKDKLTANIAVNDIFKTYNFRGYEYYNDGTMGKLDQIRQTRTISFSLYYNFNIGKTFNSRKLDRSNKDEKGRL